MLSERQVRAVVLEVNSKVNLPFMDENKEGELIQKYVDRLNPHVGPALDKICGTTYCMAIKTALNENMPLDARRKEITRLLRSHLSLPLSRELNDKVNVSMLSERTEQAVLKTVTDKMIKKFVQWIVGDWIDDTFDAGGEVTESRSGVGEDDDSDCEGLPEDADFAMMEQPALFGGEGGIDFDHGRHTRVKAVTINAGELVDAISITYADGEEHKHGGDGGYPQSLSLGYDEFIQEVVVRATDKRVVCLTLRTNTGRTLGPCGGDGGLWGIGGGEEQTVTAPDGGMLVGLMGKSGDVLDAIGFRWGRLPVTKLIGGAGGVPFDDGKNKRITSVTVCAGTLVDAIKVVYDGGEKETHHGGEGGYRQSLEVDGEDEYINAVTVRDNGKVVMSLMFHTNTGRTLGPCGGDGGLWGIASGEERTFAAPEEDFMLVGVQGKAGSLLDAIGFHWGPTKNSSWWKPQE